MSSQILNKYKEVLEALDKHLRDNVIIHHGSEFEETEGPNTQSATTVAFCENKNSDTKFVKKHQGLQETITEVIAGSLYKTLLYNRSPTFKLLEASGIKHDCLNLKSNLLRDFTTLAEFLDDKRKKKLLDLIYEEFASENGQKELIMYMSISQCNVERFKDFIKVRRERIKGSEEFFDSIIKQLENKDPYTQLENLPEYKDILVQIFNHFKDDRKHIEGLFCFHINNEINQVIREERGNSIQKNLERILDKYQNKAVIESAREYVYVLTRYTSSFHTIADRLNLEEFNKEFLTKILREVKEKVKKAKEIKEQLNNYANQELKREVVGLEKIITSMMLFGYYDLHSANIGVMDIEYENRDNSKIKEKVYAKVDMSASFSNLSNTHYLDYLCSLKCIVLSSRAAEEEFLDWDATINYNKLKEEINKGCDLFINSHEYVESLIHRALFYKKPLLKTEEELDLVNELVEEIVKQAKLLKEFANSTEFASLIDNRDNLRNCNYSAQRREKGVIKTKESLIKQIVTKVKGNLHDINTSSLVDNRDYSAIVGDDESLATSNYSSGHISSNENGDNEGSTLENQNIRSVSSRKSSVLLSEEESMLDITNNEKKRSRFVQFSDSGNRNSN